MIDSFAEPGVPSPSASSWWRPDRHADRRPFLIARQRIVRALRRFFDDRGFVEVETPILQRSPGNETHLHAFATEIAGTDGAGRRPLYLHTSPEFTCKKLLAAGETRIVTFARVFRNRERGPLHHPEFTMVEWYRAGEGYETLMEDCAALLAAAAGAAEAEQLSYRGVSLDPAVPPKRLTVAEAFDRHASIDLLASINASGATDRKVLAAAAVDAGIRVAADDTWSDVFSRVVVERIEPQLGRGHATILDQYPAAEAALARPQPDDPRLAERFELYGCGVELANGFGELTDPIEQRRRFEIEMAEKQRIYGGRYPIDDDLLAALAAMQPTSGIALGLDRLVMLVTGAPSIEHVLWAPVAGGD